MKKQIILSAILFTASLTYTGIVAAQSNKGTISPVQKGTVLVNAGVGLGNEYSNNYYNTAYGTKAAIEVGMWQAGPGVITLGVEAGASFSNGGIYDNYKTNTVVVAGRSAWHYGWKVRNLDTYAGLSAGAGFQNYTYYKNENISQSEVVPVFGGFIGASYFITPSFGFNVEAGADITRIQAGIVLKLK